jgi:hypothetical protein
LLDNKGVSHTVPAVLLASGYEPFDAKRKEELGFGIYDGVINSLQLETMLKEHKVVNSLGEEPKRVVFCNVWVPATKKWAIIIVPKYVVYSSEASHRSQAPAARH